MATLAQLIGCQTIKPDNLLEHRDPACRSDLAQKAEALCGEGRRGQEEVVCFCSAPVATASASQN